MKIYSTTAPELTGAAAGTLTGQPGPILGPIPGKPTSTEACSDCHSTGWRDTDHMCEVCDGYGVFFVYGVGL